MYGKHIWFEISLKCTEYIPKNNYFYSCLSKTVNIVLFNSNQNVK